ncbi:MAG: diaminopimelate decarboxylase [Chloroflexia bacterium]|nr:diaminopimelate decarboxylase [Chloroflexia bacterium]
MPWPDTARRTGSGALEFGGVGAVEMAEEFGTPLYVFDEATLRNRARSFRTIFEAAYPASRVVYAAKAYLSPAIVSILWDEGIGLDVVSAGEIEAGLMAGVPASAMTFHGNNKAPSELRLALDRGVGLIALDNDLEIELLADQVRASQRALPVPVLIRLNPGLAPDTHHKMRTGALDSKFGFPIETGAAGAAVERLIAHGCFDLVGYHAHVGSQIFDPSLVRETIARLIRFAAEIDARHGIVPRTIVPGGGFGVADDGSAAQVSVTEWAKEAVDALRTESARFGLPLPELVVEPGRAIVGPAGVALYRVGARKSIPNVRTYVSIDGGMADNIRPSLYGAEYSAELANRANEGREERVAVAGKYCESGDILIPEISLPTLEPGDLLAVPMAGAYCLAMASNYNLAPRPAAVMVADGRVRLIRRRETIGDMLATEILPEPKGARW